jgi:hypothetical protein
MAYAAGVPRTFQQRNHGRFRGKCRVSTGPANLMWKCRGSVATTIRGRPRRNTDNCSCSACCRPLAGYVFSAPTRTGADTPREVNEHAFPVCGVCARLRLDCHERRDAAATRSRDGCATRFMESPFSFFHMHWDHEPRTSETANKISRPYLTALPSASSNWTSPQPSSRISDSTFERSPTTTQTN